MKLDMFGKVDGVERALEYHLQRHNRPGGEPPGPLRPPGYRMRESAVRGVTRERDGRGLEPDQPSTSRRAEGEGELDFAVETEEA